MAADTAHRFHGARWKAAGFVAGALFVAAIATLMIAEDPAVLITRHVWLLSTMCGLAAVIYLWFAATWIRELVRAGPVLEVDPIGITDHRLGPDPIPWSVVSNIKLHRVHRRPFLELTMDPPQPRRGRVVAFLNRRRLAGGPQSRRNDRIQISLAGLRARPEDVLAAIRDSFETRNRMEPLITAQAAE